MDWLATLRRSGGFNALARQVGARPTDVEAGAATLLPALLSGLRQLGERLGGGENGTAQVLSWLIEQGGGQLAADVMGPGSLDTTPGEAILARIIGPEVARRAVVAEATRASKMDDDDIERLLPPLAMLVAGYITARAAGGHGDPGELFADQGAEDRI